jgi:expansin (peptidoglycan-binding protein)
MSLRRAGFSFFAVSLVVVIVACSDADGDGGLVEPGPSDPTTTEGGDASAASGDAGASSTLPDAAASPDAAPSSDAGAPTVYSGQATHYIANGTGACGQAILNTQLVAALNASQYSKANCGRCAEVKGPLGSVTVKIQDKCPGCAYGDLDLSQTAFTKIAKVADGRVKITWSFVACPPGI